MCTNENIEDVLRQLQNCRNTREMRQLLVKVNPCHSCSQNMMPHGNRLSDHSGCLCEVELQNLVIHYVTKQNSFRPE